jgi:hypothetical protein
LFTRRDAAQLALCLADAARGLGAAVATGEAGRHLAEDKYDLRRMLQAYDELFTTLTKKRAIAPSPVERGS